MKRYCRKCGTRVRKETEKELQKEYPFYCPKCDENLFGFETDIKESEAQAIINRLKTEIAITLGIKPNSKKKEHKNVRRI